MFKNPMTACDFYKLGHMTMDVPGVQKVISTWTPRSHKYTPDCPYTVNFGYQWSVVHCFIEFFDEFFLSEFEVYEEDFFNTTLKTFNFIYLEKVVDCFRELHYLGYLPIEVWAVPEGYLLADGVPAVMMFNTVDGFGWLPQFLEDLWSMNNWLPSTSATTAYYRRKAAEPFFDRCKDPTAIRRLCGDFSMRGMTGIEASAISSAGHLLSFDRTATINANSILGEYYMADLETNPVGFGVPSLEHSVVEKGVAYFLHHMHEKTLELPYAYIADHLYAQDEKTIAEACFLYYMLTVVQPDGNFTYVSDTYDFWTLIGVVVPYLRDFIMARSGKLIIRPDSGDPVKIILGDPDTESSNLFKQQGALEILSKTFGVKYDENGLKILHPSIGLIYGDAITAERQNQILSGMNDKKFSAECISLGIGAYTYQYVTRDTRGFAIKATGCVIDGIGEVPIFKEPKTDTTKKSQRGAVIVEAPDNNIVSEWQDGVTLDEALNCPYQAMRKIFSDGMTYNCESIYTIRNRLWKGKF